MSIMDSFQTYCGQSSGGSMSIINHQDGHVDYTSGSDDYNTGTHHDKHVDCDMV